LWRILNILILIQKELLDVPILYLSAFIIRQKEDYYYLLNKITATNNWEKWIIYNLKAIEETAIYTIAKIEEINRLFVNTHNLIKEKLPHIRKETIEKILEQPYISPKQLIDNNVRSINTAKKYLGQMGELGIMIPKKIGKEVVFLNIDLYNLLSESTPKSLKM